MRQHRYRHPTTRKVSVHMAVRRLSSWMCLHVGAVTCYTRVLDPFAALHRVLLSLSAPSHAAVVSALATHACADTSVITHVMAILTEYASDTVVRGIELIHTPALVTRYEAARAEMNTRGIPFKERITFHGTTRAARKAICQHGFKHKHSKYPGTQTACNSCSMHHTHL